jgi:hypothetical protein
MLGRWLRCENFNTEPIDLELHLVDELVIAADAFGQVGVAGRQSFDRPGYGRFGLAAEEQYLVPERVDLLISGVSLH